MLYRMSCLWNDKKIRAFVKKVLLLSSTVFLITIICIVGAYILGIPVLSFLYNTDLSQYKTELLMLLVGGGFLGLSGVLNAAITIMRFQNALLIGYTAVSFLAFLMSERIVQRYEMMGAAVLYTILMAILCVFFVGIFIIGVFRRYKK